MRFVVYGAAVDRFRVFVDKLDIQRLRIDLAHAVAFSVAGETVQKNGDIGFDVCADEAELVALLHTEGRVRRELRLALPAKLLKEVPAQISGRLLAVHASEKSLAAQQQAERGVVEPADRPEFQKDRLSLRHDRAVAQLDIAAGASLIERETDQPLAAERIDRNELSRGMHVGSRVMQRAAAVFPLRHFAQACVDEKGRIASELRRDHAVFILDAAQQLFIPLVEQERGAQRAGAALAVPAETVNTAVGEEVVDPALRLVQKAVVRRRQQRKVRGRGRSADRLEERKGFFENLFM